MSIRPRPGAQEDNRSHVVENVAPELPDQNLFLGDEVLLSAMRREGVEWVEDRAIKVGEMTGSTRYRDLAAYA